MKKFPQSVKPENCKKFDDCLRKIQLEKYRNEIFTYILSRNSSGFDFTECAQRNGLKTISSDHLKIIVNELNKLGWQTSLQYGDTMLYIFTENINKPRLYGVEIQ